MGRVVLEEAAPFFNSLPKKVAFGFKVEIYPTLTAFGKDSLSLAHMNACLAYDSDSEGPAENCEPGAFPCPTGLNSMASCNTVLQNQYFCLRAGTCPSFSEKALL